MERICKSRDDVGNPLHDERWKNGIIANKKIADVSSDEWLRLFEYWGGILWMVGIFRESLLNL